MNDYVEQTEVMLGRVLTIGTRISTALLAIGLVLTFLGPAATVAPYALRAGLVVLLATPIARVALSMVAFARARDWVFLIFTTIVFELLVSSIIVALNW